MTAPADLLPRPATAEAFLALRGDPSVWLPAMRVIARRHDLDPDALYAERSGTHVVFRAGDEAWIKLVMPLWQEDHERERCALAALDGEPGVVVPPLRADGTLEGWTYLVMGTVPGRPIVTVWEDLGREAQADLARQLGLLMARMHAVDAAPLTALAGDWDAFVRRQRAECVARHAEAGADAAWQEQIAGYLAEAPSPDEPGAPHVLLHADITDEHVFVAEQAGRWTITGLIDFADAMLGPPLYDFAAPAVFLSARRPWAQRALLRGYGAAQALTPDLARHLTTYVLLHRFGRLPEILRCCPPPRPRSMAELERALLDLGTGPPRAT